MIAGGKTREPSRAGYPACTTMQQFVSRLIAALTSGADRQSFQFRKPRRPTEGEMAFNKILGLRADSRLAAITRYAPCVSLAAKELPIWYEKRASQPRAAGGCIDRRDISSFNGILVQL
jgi:hypothetical protein